jgi:hypothetical protein
MAIVWRDVRNLRYAAEVRDARDSADVRPVRKRKGGVE